MRCCFSHFWCWYDAPQYQLLTCNSLLALRSLSQYIGKTRTVKEKQTVSMFGPCINSIEALFIVPTDAHNYKFIGILKQLKFRRLLRHVSVHAGTIIREHKSLLCKRAVVPHACTTGWYAAITLTTSLTASTIES
jgi:hypothetical protein